MFFCFIIIKSVGNRLIPVSRHSPNPNPTTGYSERPSRNPTGYRRDSGSRPFFCKTIIRSSRAYRNPLNGSDLGVLPSCDHSPVTRTRDRRWISRIHLEHGPYVQARNNVNASKSKNIPKYRKTVQPGGRWVSGWVVGDL